jgi:hypothetical protein
MEMPPPRLGREPTKGNLRKPPCRHEAGVQSFRATGVNQAKRAILGGLTHDVECAAATGGGLLRARVGAGRALNQRGGAAIGQKQRRGAAATVQRGERAHCQRRAGQARE